MFVHYDKDCCTLLQVFVKALYHLQSKDILQLLCRTWLNRGLHSGLPARTLHNDLAALQILAWKYLGQLLLAFLFVGLLFFRKASKVYSSKSSVLCLLTAKWSSNLHTPNQMKNILEFFPFSCQKEPVTVSASALSCQSIAVSKLNLGELRLCPTDCVPEAEYNGN